MRILIAGASGFVGTALRSFLEGKGHEVYVLVRHQPSSLQNREIRWNPSQYVIESSQLEGFDAFINLAGENIAEGRWTEKRKQQIHDSRINSTLLLCKTATQLNSPPKTIINASAVGFYGNQGDAVLDESSALGSGFLADVCKQWEEATHSAQEAGIRVVLLRFGAVMGMNGGILKKVVPPFKWGLGGRLGSGQQYMSWIAIDDLLQIIDFCLQNPQLSGPVNVVTPEPVTNLQFTKALGEVVSRPTVLPLPESMVRLIFGEMGDEMILSSARAVPRKLENAGYQFLYPNLRTALQKLINESN